MPHPFFDQTRYLWARAEASRLHDALHQALTAPAEIDLLYKKSSGDLPPLDFKQRPDLIWKEALEQLASHRALRRFCELCAEHKVLSIKEAGLAMMEVEAILDVSPVPDGKPEDPAAQARLETLESSRPPAGAHPLHVVGREDVAPAVVLSLHERHLRALGDALKRVVPRIFGDSRIRARRLDAAKSALLSLDPLMEALSAAAEEETQQPMRQELQDLDDRLQHHKRVVSGFLSALDQVRSKRAARRPCDELAKETTSLLAAGAEAVRRVT